MTASFAPLNETDIATLAAIEASGRSGLTVDEVGLRLKGRDVFVAVAAFLKRVRKRGHAVATVQIGREGCRNVYRYAMADAIAEPIVVPVSTSRCAEFGIRVVQREVRSDPAVATCAKVSLAYLACLDAPAARATGGEGSV